MKKSSLRLSSIPLTGTEWIIKAGKYTSMILEMIPGKKLVIDFLYFLLLNWY
ncbi:hypothetical protein HYZ05_02345 [Candidatus Daviesbacteria bacterium]|nr:hypothetical protein [Candidatus Daviesbacteria bacterium]